MHQAFVEKVLRFRMLIIIATVALIIVASQGLDKVVVLSDYKSFIDPDYPELLRLEEIDDIFSENNVLMIAIAPNDGQVFKEKTVRLIQDLTKKAWLLPYASRVDSISNYQHTEVIEDDLIVGDLLSDEVIMTQALLDRARHVSSSEPSLKKNLISERQHVAVINITFQVPDDIGPTEVNDAIILAVKQLLKDSRSENIDTDFYLTGMVTVDDSLSKYGKKDSMTLIPAMLLLMVVVLFIMTRSFSGVLSASIIVIFTGVGTMGALGWGGWIIDPGSAISPIVIMTLAVADSIHVIEAMQNAMRQGMSKVDAIRQSLRDNFVPVFLTSLTTVMGVITFTFADLPSLRRLGVTVALGVTIAFILSVTLLPALLSIFPMKVKPKKQVSTVFTRIGQFSIRYYRIIVPITLVLSVSLISLAPLNRFNDSPGAMLALSTPERQAVEFYESNVSGVIKIDVAIFTGKSGGVNDPNFLANIENFVLWLREQDNIDHVATLTDTFKRLNQNMHGDDPEWYRLPEEKDLAAQYLLLYEMSLPYGLDLNNQLNLDKSAMRMTVILKGGDSQLVVETKWAIEEWFANNTEGLEVDITGTTPLLAELSYVHMIPSMMKGGMIAILMVSLVLFVSLRRFKLGFIGMLANMIPVAVGYGVWYLLDGQVNFVIASVAGVCLGVVVDFAVHFLSKYQQKRNAGGDTESAILYAFSKTGRPLFTTMVVLVSGFGLLMLSPITMNFSMGCLTGIVIMLALAFDFLMLPALLMMLDKQPKKYSVDVRH